VVVRLVKQPAHGTLTDPATGASLVNGSLLATASTWPYTAALAVNYLGAAHYFNAPSVRFNGSDLGFDDGAGYVPNGDDVIPPPKTRLRLIDWGSARLHARAFCFRSRRSYVVFLSLSRSLSLFLLCVLSIFVFSFQRDLKLLDGRPLLTGRLRVRCCRQLLVSGRA
jgi:hypothetical protein